MPATVNSDKMALVHSSSSGTSPAFPDVCKTPTPAGPIPIPYPNIAQSSDTGEGSSTVKVDGNPTLTKDAKYSTSAGDEAGSAMGVVSSKNKGESKTLLYSFTVKSDGKNNFRLVDTMLQNKGGAPNTPPATTVEPPVIALPMVNEPCDNTKKKLEKDPAAAAPAWEKSGVISAHRSHIKTAATDLRMVLHIRKTSPDNKPWIEKNFRPKPHSCMSGKTIEKGQAPMVQAWLDDFFKKMHPSEKDLYPASAPPAAGSRHYSRTGADYVGIIGQSVGNGRIKPLKGSGTQTISYENTWMTGDYDLFEVLLNGPGCFKVEGDAFAMLKKMINTNCSWDAIQHGPQAQWVPNAKEIKAGVKPTNMNSNVKAALQKDADRTIEVPVLPPPRSDMKVLDKPLTIVCGDGVGELKDQNEVAEALICQECDK